MNNIEWKYVSTKIINLVHDDYVYNLIHDNFVRRYELETEVMNLTCIIDKAVGELKRLKKVIRYNNLEMLGIDGVIEILEGKENELSSKS